MVKLQLSIKAELDNVTDLQPESEDFEYFFKVECTSCREQHPNLVTLNPTEERELKGSKNATANFVWRCNNCKRESSAKFETSKPQPYSIESNGQFSPLITVECRGLEFVGFDPKGVWKCKGMESNTPFQVDLSSETEWEDYDEKAAQPVTVMSIEGKWGRA